MRSQNSEWFKCDIKSLESYRLVRSFSLRKLLPLISRLRSAHNYVSQQSVRLSGQGINFYIHTDITKKKVTF